MASSIAANCDNKSTAGGQDRMATREAPDAGPILAGGTLPAAAGAD